MTKFEKIIECVKNDWKNLPESLQERGLEKSKIGMTQKQLDKAVAEGIMTVRMVKNINWKGKVSYENLYKLC